MRLCLASQKRPPLTIMSDADGFTWGQGSQGPCLIHVGDVCGIVVHL